MLANTARASRALDDDAHEISTRRLAYWRRAHRRAQKTNVGAASGKTDLNHISYFHKFHTSLNTMMRDDFDHHRGTPAAQEFQIFEISGTLLIRSPGNFRQFPDPLKQGVIQIFHERVGQPTCGESARLRDNVA